MSEVDPKKVLSSIGGVKVTEKTKTKPEWNRWDNIWEIRESGYPSEEQVEEVLSTEPMFKRTHRIGKAIIFDNEDHFIQVVGKSKVKLPVWKVLCPHLDNPNQGAIYYIVQTEERNLVFRGTYGYWGVGPHQSAMIEHIFQKVYHLYFDVRSGDYLLTLMGLH